MEQRLSRPELNALLLPENGVNYIELKKVSKTLNLSPYHQF